MRQAIPFTNEVQQAATRIERSAARLALPLVIMAAIAAGCRSEPVVELPVTYPVHGRVVSRSGQDVQRGAVEFRALSDVSVRAVGEIQPDGTFALQSIVQNELVEGAVAGEHEVIVHALREGSHAPESHRLPRPQSVAAADNQLTLNIP